MRYRDIIREIIEEMPTSILIQDPTKGKTYEVQIEQEALQARASMFVRKEHQFYGQGVQA